MIRLTTFDRCPRLAELKVSYRRSRKVNTQQETLPFVVADRVRAEDYFRRVWNPDTIDYLEEVYLACVDTRLQPLGWVKLATGGFDSVPIDPRVVFGIALQTASAGILLAHNHPSGDLSPSLKDLETTARLKAAGETLGVKLHDHLILGRDGAVSLAERGHL